VWKSKAAAVRKRDNYRCRACNKKPYRKKWYEFWRRKDWLTVHHGSYEEWKQSPGSEPMRVLFTLCRNCHDEIHARHRSGQFGSHGGSLLDATHSVIQTKQLKIANQRNKEARKMEKQRRKLTTRKAPLPRR
jgi:hypothetical protein